MVTCLLAGVVGLALLPFWAGVFLDGVGFACWEHTAVSDGGCDFFCQPKLPRVEQWLLPWRVFLLPRSPRHHPPRRRHPRHHPFKKKKKNTVRHGWTSDVAFFPPQLKFLKLQNPFPQMSTGIKMNEKWVHFPAGQWSKHAVKGIARDQRKCFIPLCLQSPDPKFNHRVQTVKSRLFWTCISF